MFIQKNFSLFSTNIYFISFIMPEFIFFQNNGAEKESVKYIAKEK